MIMITFTCSYLRIDTLAQMLTQANVRSGSKVLLFENCSGLVLGALMERLGGRYMRTDTVSHSGSKLSYF